MVSTWTGNPEKKQEKTFSSFQFYPKYWKNEEILASSYFSFDFLIEVYLLNSLNKTLKKYWKMERKYWKSQGNLSVRKCGNHG